MSKFNYDLIIIGAGPAGLAAAVYSARRALKTLVIAKSIGGQMALAREIENYPGFELIPGFELAEKFLSQAKKFGAEFEFNEVASVKKNKSGFTVYTSQKEYSASAVILAFGLTPKNLDAPGEKELTGRGVSYCATCDGPFYKNKIVAVAGGGNSALESAEYLARLAKKVYLIHRSENFSADKYLLAEVKKMKNVEFACCYEVKEVKGENKVEGLVLQAVGKKETKEINLDGVFVEIGHQAKTDWLKGAVDLNAKGEIIIGRGGVSSVPGIFAAGDCSDDSHKQVVIAAGAGAQSALEAYKFITAKKGKVIAPDWGKRK